MAMNLLFVGPQGSGKGTQAKIISEKLGIPHISTGDLLRGAQGDLKKQVDEFMLAGKLVPDELMLRILKARLEKGCEGGFILDGFPRNIEQARELDKIVKIDNLFNIEISDGESLKRLSGRWNCKKCGIGYNYVTEPKPKQRGVCDNCGEKLEQRADDNEEAITKRLEIYHAETKLIIKHYNSVKISGEQSIERVTEDIMKAVKFIQMFK